LVRKQDLLYNKRKGGVLSNRGGVLPKVNISMTLCVKTSQNYAKMVKRSRKSV